MASSIEELSYSLTVDALAEQERAVLSLRTRAGTVVAAASISGSFLGARSSHTSLDLWAVLALVAFVLCLASAIWILLPHKMVFAFRGEALLAESDRLGVTEVTEAYRGAGRWIEPNLDANRDTLGVSIRLVHGELHAPCPRSHPLDSQPHGVDFRVMATVAPKPQPTSRPPAQLPATPPPGFAIPEKRGGLFGN